MKYGYALVAIDLQEDFREDTEPNLLFESNIINLFAYCRSNGIEIIHINGLFKKDKTNWLNWTKLRGNTVLLEGSGGEKRLPYALSEQNEKEIIKNTFDGFLNTDLEEYLNERKIKGLLICGLITSVCVLITALTAIQKGFLVSVLSDCCSDSSKTHDFILNEYDYLINPIKENEITERIMEMDNEIDKLMLCK